MLKRGFSSLRGLAGLGELLDESSANDVEDELERELEDNPGTTPGTKFSVLHRIPFPFLVRCGFFTTGPLVGFTVLIAELA